MMLRSRFVLAAAAFALAAHFAAAQGTESLVERARELTHEKRYDEAIGVLDQVVTAAPEDVDALMARGEALRLAGRHEAAWKDYAAVTRLRPRELDAWFWVGTLDRWAGRDADAVRAYGRVLEIRGCHVDALNGRARSRIRMGDVAGAESDLRVALVCRPGDAEASQLLAETLAKRGDDAAARGIASGVSTGPDREMDLGDVAALRGDWAEAADHFRRALASRPESAPLHRRMGDAERELGRTQAAIDSYRRAAALDPADAVSAYWIGVLESRVGTADAATAAWDELLRRKPGDTAALVGKARILYRRGERRAALDLLNQALAASPRDQDGLLLRGEILRSYNDAAAARADFRAVGGIDLNNLDAWRALDQVGPRRYWGVDAAYEDNRVIEGLEDAGLQTPAGPIVPSRIDYLTESAGGNLLVPVNESTGLAAGLSARREAVTNLDTDVDVYDFDILEGSAGLNHALSRAWSLEWRLGATRYSPRSPGALERRTEFLGSVRAQWRADRQRMSMAAVADSFLWRGFAGDTTFRIFSRTRLNIDWERNLGGEWFVGAAGNVADYDDGNTVGAVWLSAGWTRGTQAVTFRYRHDPFPARFLTVPDNTLDFISYDVISVEGETALGAGFHLSGSTLAGLYGATPETVETDTSVPPDGIPDRVEGPDRRNTQWLARATLGWTPATFPPLTLGVDAFVDHYAFDTGDYNNINTVSWTPFVQLAGDAGPRWHYSARYGHGFINDERDSSYGSNTFYGSLDARLGRLDRLDDAPRLGVEARVDSNGLDENYDRFRFFLRFPF